MDEEIKELQELKKTLKTAKEIVLTAGAEIFIEYGIDKLDGSGISSITFSGAVTADKTKLVVHNEEALIKAGFYKKVIDEAKILHYYSSDNYANVILEHSTLEVISISKPAKIKINKRRVINNPTHTLEEEVA